MLIDLATNTPESALQADIAIIGAGAAGITLARQLRSSGARVLLIESGGADYQRDAQALYDGAVSGTDYYRLRDARLRFFGGTTAIWGGRCARLDAIDFTRRDWIPHSGWPLTASDLDSWYARAQQALQLPVVAGNTMPGFVDPLQDGELRASFWQFDDAFSRFTLPSCRDLSHARDITVLLNSTLVDLQTSDCGRHISGMTIADPRGTRTHVSARFVVLAAGGLETPRLLLATQTAAHPRGIGNKTDQVGRYFMEHPHARGARIISRDPERLFRTFPSFRRDASGQRYGLLLRPRESTQCTEAILNTCFTFGVFRHAGEKPALHKQTYSRLKHDMAPGRLGRGLWRTVKRVSRRVKERRSAASKARLLQDQRYGIYTVVRAEQAPNPESRVRLSTASRDTFGTPHIELDWQLLDIDKRSVHTAMLALDRDLRRLGLGEVQPSDWLDDPDTPWEFDHLVTSHPYGGYHHMGTTRMGNDPATSVVDANCRVHGMDNLYIAGSSVFPTGGWANPTLTIIALAMRLGDHLRGRLPA